MSERIFSRTECLLGAGAMEKLAACTVFLFGLGGVGSYAFEAIVRSGIGCVHVVDYARIDETNINRQLLALHSTIGKFKTEAAAERASDINPLVKIIENRMFIDAGNIGNCIKGKVDYILDAIDSVESKMALIEFAHDNDIPIVSCMGTGNKVQPERLRISDIYETATDPLARILRQGLKKRNIKSLDVVWSDEIPLLRGERLPINNDGKRVPASTAYVPAAAGILMASHIVNRLASIK
ncbi:MAG: tRNA threonylcarbamoyladenosine dehydratase [Clostridia bacterium]|nr:tRNA threonylcarbamoyladenosine dehydratase [Clostridia bacterium]